MPQFKEDPLPITLHVDSLDSNLQLPFDFPLKEGKDQTIPPIPLQNKIIGLAGWAIGKSVAIQCEANFYYVSYYVLEAWVKRNRVDPDSNLLDLNRILSEIKKYQTPLLALKKDPFQIHLISDDLLKERRFIELALKQNGLLLERLSQFNDDEALVDIALKSNPEAIRFASERLKWKKTLEETLTRLKKHPKDINLLPEKFFADPLFMQEAVQLPPFLNENSPHYVRKNVALAKAQINQSKDQYHHIDPLLKDDEALYLLAFSDKKPLKKARDAFELAHLALHRARQRMSGIPEDASWKDKQYRLASYYILLEMSIEDDSCSGLYLALEEAVSTQPACSKKRKPLEVFERDPITQEMKKQVIQLSCDIFTSLKTTCEPISLKRLLQKSPEAFYAFSEKLLHPEGKEFTEQEQELYNGLLTLGKSLKDQFIEEDPYPLFGPPLYRAFQALIQEKVLTEENQYSNKINDAIGSIATAEMLLKKTKLSPSHVTLEGDDGTKLEFPLPSQNFYCDQEGKKPFIAPYLTPFSGRLAGEENVPLITDEYERILKKKSEMKENELFLLSYLINLRAIEPLKNPTHTKASISEELGRSLHSEVYSSSKRRLYESSPLARKGMSFVISEIRFKEIQAVAEDIESVGELISKRYLSGRLNDFISSIEFDFLGKVSSINHLDSFEPLLTRSANEHRLITERYLPGLNAPLRPRKMSPRFDRTKDKNFLFADLFHRILPKDPTGSCCVGALAQGIGGKYNPITGSSLSLDYSQDLTWINALRKGAADYMRDHPQEFFDYVDGTDKMKSVNDRASKIGPNFANFWLEDGWFTLAEIKAVSSIIGRPIHIITRYKSHFRLTPEGEIESIKINNHFNHEILYLYFSNPHYYLLSPRRSATIPLPYWDVVLRD